MDLYTQIGAQKMLVYSGLGRLFGSYVESHITPLDVNKDSSTQEKVKSIAKSMVYGSVNGVIANVCGIYADREYRWALSRKESDDGVSISVLVKAAALGCVSGGIGGLITEAERLYHIPGLHQFLGPWR